uniref:Small ribosomal subunit protein uS5c n=1 Tax=Neogoniolithon spectabile TaxID=231755 RepID=A0A3G3MGU0_9FLOR|nr:ribosomal protein S5 [Neogoniolithon spectabile]AYR06021.1 ribosomal protein S5 [Neogoniolithon spectabile]
MSHKKKNNKIKEQEKQWEERVIQIKRVTKVVKGGKKLSFRAITIVGDEKGQVGVGVGKASDVINAVKKGVADAKKQVIHVPLTKTQSIPHKIIGTSGSAQVIMRPSASGSGVIAGGSVRTVLELAGLKNVLTKQLGSKSVLNNARATIDALAHLRTLAQAANERSIRVEKLYS